MKKLLYIGYVLTICSCGSAQTESVSESESTVSTVNINKKEVSSIKIGSLEVTTEETYQTWDGAHKACADLGEGWRLPTLDELNIIYQNKAKIGGFNDSIGAVYYWSLKEDSDDWGLVFDLSEQDHGVLDVMWGSQLKDDYAFVRAVRGPYVYGVIDADMLKRRGLDSWEQE